MMALRLWSFCVWLDIKLAAVLLLPLPSWTISLWIGVCEERGSTKCTVSISSWSCSSLSLVWVWGCKGRRVTSCSFFTQADEWGRHETSASLNSSSGCWMAQSSWASSLMCRGVSGPLRWTLGLSSCSQWSCSGEISSLQVDDSEMSRKRKKLRN